MKNKLLFISIFYTILFVPVINFNEQIQLQNHALSTIGTQLIEKDVNYFYEKKFNEEASPALENFVTDTVSVLNWSNYENNFDKFSDIYQKMKFTGSLIVDNGFHLHQVGNLLFETNGFFEQPFPQAIAKASEISINCPHDSLAKVQAQILVFRDFTNIYFALRIIKETNNYEGFLQVYCNISKVSFY